MHPLQAIAQQQSPFGMTSPLKFFQQGGIARRDLGPVQPRKMTYVEPPEEPYPFGDQPYYNAGDEAREAAQFGKEIFLDPMTLAGFAATGPLALATRIPKVAGAARRYISQGARMAGKNKLPFGRTQEPFYPALSAPPAIAAGFGAYHPEAEAPPDSREREAALMRYYMLARPEATERMWDVRPDKPKRKLRVPFVGGDD
jgi:hypothetical protein